MTLFLILVGALALGALVVGLFIYVPALVAKGSKARKNRQMVAPTTPQTNHAVPQGRPHWQTVLWASGAILLATLLAVIFFPSHLVVHNNESVWNVIVSNRWFVDGIRVVAGLLGVYLVVSMVALAHQNIWINQAGPFAASQDQKVSQLQAAVAERDNKIDSLGDLLKQEQERTAVATAIAEDLRRRLGP